jgi:hypothetical protein
MEKSRFAEFTPPPTTGLQPFTGSFGNSELRHLLRRTLFGVTKADMTYFSGKSMVQVVDELLNPTAPLPAPPVKEYVVAATTLVPDNKIVAGITWVYDINND